ncbi:adipocyte plasma membrane-associated protein-like [Varroa destructor]|uniref:Strictosidine synthase conserved region domain-containing protein n=1 Tax=Varroa destructor TaxID=109461 RepID=A0A7M7JG63_VARDE|nr:adipocyte plasma membrane-associated protein-like [Varroa destructor]
MIEIMEKQWIYRSALAVLLALTGNIVLTCAEDGPLCLAYGDGKSFCSSSDVDNGKSLSNLLNSVLQLPVDRKGRMELAINEPFTDPIPEAIGPLKANQKLDENSQVVMSFLNGPESLAVQADFLYAATADGVYQINMKTQEQKKLYDARAGCNSSYTTSCSRPLGIRVKDLTILCADPLKGLLQIDIDSGNVKVLIPALAEVEGKKMLMADDLDVDWERGLIYLSDVSTKYGFHRWAWSIVDNDASGRVIQYNLATGEASVFAKDIRFPNGIQITHDGKSLLVSEFTARRILQYPLGQPLPVKGTPFTKHPLPGSPDNIRPSLSGGYWVALPLGRINGSRTFVDELQARPTVAKRLGDWILSIGEAAQLIGQLGESKDLSDIGVQLQSGAILQNTYPRVSTIVELDAEGNVLQALQTYEHRLITQATELDDGLYLGSLLNKYIVFVPRSSYGRS